MEYHNKRIKIRQRNKDINTGKMIAYYSSIYNAWLNTRMEGDKSILTLSVSALRLLITLFATISKITKIEFILFLIAILFFLCTAILIIIIYNKNSDFLESIAKEDEIHKHEKTLKRLDIFSRIFFFLGLIISLINGILFAIKKII